MLTSLTQETHDYKHLMTIMAQGIPLVLFVQRVKDIEVGKVVVDDFNGACKAVSYLIRLGRKPIAHIGGKN